MKQVQINKSDNSKPLTVDAVLDPEKPYWAADIRNTFWLTRASITEMKKKYPERFMRCRRGDLILGSAVMQYLAEEWGKSEESHAE